MLGRDMVATWLNYLANNQETIGECIGDVSGVTNTPREYLDAAIDWMQQFASDQNSASNGTNQNTSFHDGNTQATFQFDARVNPSSTAWQIPFGPGEDIPVSGAAMHSALDGYNNTGAIGGVQYCCDADSELAALHERLQIGIDCVGAAGRGQRRLIEKRVNIGHGHRAV